MQHMQHVHRMLCPSVQHLFDVLRAGLFDVFSVL
jgi:hypothetical protein